MLCLSKYISLCNCCTLNEPGLGEFLAFNWLNLRCKHKNVQCRIINEKAKYVKKKKICNKKSSTRYKYLSIYIMLNSDIQTDIGNRNVQCRLIYGNAKCVHCLWRSKTDSNSSFIPITTYNCAHEKYKNTLPRPLPRPHRNVLSIHPFSTAYRINNRLTYTVIYSTIFYYSVTELLHIDLKVLPFYEDDIYCV